MFSWVSSLRSFLPTRIVYASLFGCLVLSKNVSVKVSQLVITFSCRWLKHAGPEISFARKIQYQICRAFVKETLEPSKIRIVSSAYWLILISCQQIAIPLISLFFLSFSDSISKQRIKRYGERGQPCLTPFLFKEITRPTVV